MAYLRRRRKTSRVRRPGQGCAPPPPLLLLLLLGALGRLPRPRCPLQRPYVPGAAATPGPEEIPDLLPVPLRLRLLVVLRRGGERERRVGGGFAGWRREGKGERNLPVCLPRCVFFFFSFFFYLESLFYFFPSSRVCNKSKKISHDYILFKRKGSQPSS